MINPVRPIPAPLNRAPALAGQGDIGMSMGRPVINSNISQRLAPQLNHAPAMAGAGEAPPMVNPVQPIRGVR